MYERKQIPKHWEEAGVVVVSAGGKANVDRPVIIFQGLGIPTYFVWDADGSETNQNKSADDTNGSRLTNQRLQRLACLPAITDWPTTQLGEGFSVLSVDMENLCKETLTIPIFLAIRDEALNEVGYDSEKKDGLKSVECAAAFIRLAYGKYGKSLPMLEDIVKKVSATVSTEPAPMAKASA